MTTDRGIAVKCVSQDQHNVLGMTASPVMPREVKAIGPGGTLKEAANRMPRHQVRRPPVEDGRLALGVMPPASTLKARRGASPSSASWKRDRCPVDSTTWWR